MKRYTTKVLKAAWEGTYFEDVHYKDGVLTLIR